MTKLAYLHEPGVLYNLKCRYDENEIYVSLVDYLHVSMTIFGVWYASFIYLYFYSVGFTIHKYMHGHTHARLHTYRSVCIHVRIFLCIYILAVITCILWFMKLNSLLVFSDLHGKYIDCGEPF